MQTTLPGRRRVSTSSSTSSSAAPSTSAAAAPTPRIATSPLTVAKLRHDADQFAYLQGLGALGSDFTPVIARYRQLAKQMAEAGITQRARLTADEQALIGAVYNQTIHVRATPAVAQALSGSWRGVDVERAYGATPPGVVVIDDFLSPEALASLRRFCLESTIWNGLRYSHGRLGALHRDGFACPLLMQIDAQLRAALPQLIGTRHALTQLWAYKYPPRMPGDDVHADFAAINVNFWITPDDANLDPASGGLIIHDVEAPADWDFTSYNRRPQLIRDYLAQVGARQRTIAYRQNRAIIFNSDLFHGTAACHFRDDYESRRINVTMLYGERHDDAFRQPAPPMAAAAAAAATAPAAMAPPPHAGPAAAWRSAAFKRARR